MPTDDSREQEAHPTVEVEPDAIKNAIAKLRAGEELRPSEARHIARELACNQVRILTANLLTEVAPDSRYAAAISIEIALEFPAMEF